MSKRDRNRLQTDGWTAMHKAAYYGLKRVFYYVDFYRSPPLASAILGVVISGVAIMEQMEHLLPRTAKEHFCNSCRSDEIFGLGWG